MPIRASTLAELRNMALQAPRHTPGTVTLDEYTIEYNDALSLYVEIKNIFFEKIYDVRPVSDRPFIVDGGAHLGIAALYYRLRFPASRIVCFEPDPKVNAMLRRNLERNGLGDVAVVEAGLSGTDGTAAFLPDSADGGKIVADDAGAFSIRTEKLSHHLDGPLDILKLNVEGAELPVLRELEEAGHLRAVQHIVLEYHGWPNRPQYLGAILETLDRNGFRYLVHDFDKETNPATKPPFYVEPATLWFSLVYARNPLWNP